MPLSLHLMEHRALQVMEKADYSGVTNLSSNEIHNPVVESQLATYLNTVTANQVATYPYLGHLKHSLSQSLALPPQQIILSAGSDLAIHHLLIHLTHKHKRVILQTPTYSSYQDYATLLGIEVTTCSTLNKDEPTFTADLKKVLISHPPSLLILTNPDCYLGQHLAFHYVRELMEFAIQHNHLVLIDEAYTAYANIEHMPLLNEYSNLTLLRSYSKYPGLAGLRLAAIFTQTEIAELLKKTGLEKTVCTLSANFLAHLLHHQAELTHALTQKIGEREEGIKLLKQAFPHWKVYPSQANFITAKTNSPHQAKAICQQLSLNRIRIKDFSFMPELMDHIRFTLCSRKRMLELIDLMLPHGSNRHDL